MAEATSTRHATSAAASELVPGCPLCGSGMVVRSQWSGGRVTGLYWGCRRAPGCEGARRIRTPEQIRATVHDASAQAIFDWQSAQERHPDYRYTAPPPITPAGGLRGFFGKLRGRPTESEAADEAAERASAGASMGYFDSLVDHGFVVLENRRLTMARARIDNLLIGPSGVFLVERKTWAGQVLTTTDSVYVDGRQRPAATDDVLRATAAFERTLDYELKPLGISVKPVILFDRASNRSFEGTIGKVVVGGTRSLPRIIRGRGEPVLGPETIVRLAVAADRTLE